MRRIHLYAFVMFIIRTNGNDDTDDYFTKELGENIWNFGDVVERPDFHTEHDGTVGLTVAYSGTLETTIAPGTTKITEAHAEPVEAMVLNSRKPPEIDNEGNNWIDQMGYEFDVHLSDIEWDMDEVPHFHLSEEFTISDDTNGGFADDTYENAVANDETFKTMVLTSNKSPEIDNVNNNPNNLMEYEYDLHLSDIEWDVDEVPNFHISQEFDLYENSASDDTNRGFADDAYGNSVAHAGTFETMILTSHEPPEIDNAGNNSNNPMGYEFNAQLSDMGWNVNEVQHFRINTEFPVSDDINSGFADDTYNNAVAHDETFETMTSTSYIPPEFDNAGNNSNNLMGYEFNAHLSDMGWNVDEVQHFHINSEFPVSDDIDSGFANDTYRNMYVSSDDPVAEDPVAEDPVTAREVPESAEILHAISCDASERNNENCFVEKGESSGRDEIVNSIIPSYDTNEISEKREINGANPGANFEEDDSEMDLTAKNPVANRFTECNVTFGHKTLLEDHRKHEHGIFSPYQCRHCERKFSNKYSMMGHMKRMHKNVVTSEDLTLRGRDVLVRCGVCEITFQSYMELERHALTKHPGVRTMACQYCSKKYFQRKPLLEHARIKHSQLTLKCKHCNNIFDRTDTLNEHLEYCEQRRKYRMKDTQVEWEPFRAEFINCKECEAQFDSFKELQIHFKSEHPTSKFHPCGYCEESFAKKNTLMKHLNIRHPDKLDDLKYNKNYSLYVCQYCKKEFEGVVKYEMHGQIEHRGQPMFYCKECGKGYTLRRSLTLHDRERHGDSKYRCVYCYKCYYNSYYLKQHEIICRERHEQHEIICRKRREREE